MFLFCTFKHTFCLLMTKVSNALTQLQTAHYRIWARFLLAVGPSDRLGLGTPGILVGLVGCCTITHTFYFHFFITANGSKVEKLERKREFSHTGDLSSPHQLLTAFRVYFHWISQPANWSKVEPDIKLHWLNLNSLCIASRHLTYSSSPFIQVVHHLSLFRCVLCIECWKSSKNDYTKHSVDGEPMNSGVLSSCTLPSYIFVV